MQINEKIRAFVSQNLTIIDDERVFTDEDDIFQLGFVNSLFAMKLITFIENDFHIRVENHEMDLSNFNSISHMVNFILMKQKG